MSQRKTGIAVGEYYHLYNRGNSKQTIFHDSSDYNRFLLLMYLANGTNPFKIFFVRDATKFDRGEPLVAIGAFCLMPNHFHMLVTPAQEGGLAKFMQRITTGYSMFYNNKYDRTGGLFEGKYKAEHVHNDEYLKYLFSYIHLNPLKLYDSTWRTEGIKNKHAAQKFVEEYPYSSLSEYLGKTKSAESCLSKDSFPAYHLTPEELKKNLFVWLDSNTQVLPV